MPMVYSIAVFVDVVDGVLRHLGFRAMVSTVTGTGTGKLIDLAILFLNFEPHQVMLVI